MASVEQATINDETSIDDDDVPCLSNFALAALNEFLKEQKEEEEDEAANPFAENWGLSQVRKNNN